MNKTQIDREVQRSMWRRSGGKLSRRVNLRDTNPNLYRSLMTLSVIYICLGFNFLLTTPTFEQFGIPKEFIGLGFMLLGVMLVILLNIRRSLKYVRIMLIASIGYMLFWGVGTTQTFFEGTSSLQLFILYWGLGAVQIPLLLEPFYNPITANGKNGENGEI